MKRICILVVVMILFWAQAAFSQLSEATSVGFKVAKATDEGTTLAGWLPQGRLTWVDVTGDFVGGVRTYISTDSLARQEWSVEILRAIDTTSGHWGSYEVLVSGYLLNDRNISMTYKDTATFGEFVSGFYFPDRERLLKNDRSMSFLVPRDSLFSITLKTERHAAGEKVVIRTDNKVTVQGNIAGGLGTYSAPSLDSLTILSTDSISAANTDTSYTAAIPGAAGYITLFITGWGATSDTVPVLRLAMQRKLNGGSWAGPLTTSSYNLTAASLLDSAAVKHGATKVYDLSDWGPADSVRFRVINPSQQGRTVWTFKAVRRD